MSTPNDDKLLKASFSSVSALMGLQLFSRLFTFVLNQALFRMASPRAYGTAAIQFELMLSTILFLSREGVRNALLRVKKPTTSTTNVSFLPFLFGLPLAAATSYFYARYAGTEVKSQDHFMFSIGIYGIAALLELLGEPMHNLAMSELRTGIRVRAEGLGITAKTFMTFLVLVHDTRTGGNGALALVAFAAGQLAYGSVVLGTYISYYGTRGMWPKSLQITAGSRQFFDPQTLRLSLTMTSQSFVKHLLTEGDKFILTWFSPLQDQGGYAIAVNYGSLIARIVFQPIEETLRVYFSKTLENSSASQSIKDKNVRDNLQQAATALISLLSVQAAFSALLVVFGKAYLPIFIHILLPQQYLATSAPRVLSAWIWYVPVLAFNGGLEAFVSSAATPQDLNKQSRWMAVFSAIYIIGAVVLYGFQLGDTSLVYANILNLSVRILYCGHFISSFFADHGSREVLRWRKVVPKWPFLLITIVSAVSMQIMNERLGVIDIVGASGRKAIFEGSVMTYIGLGALLALVCLGTWWMTTGRHLKLYRRSKTE